MDCFYFSLQFFHLLWLNTFFFSFTKNWKLVIWFIIGISLIFTCVNVERGGDGKVNGGSWQCYILLYSQHVLTIGGVQTAAASVSVRTGRLATHTVESVGVLGAGEASSVVRRVHPRSTDRTVLSSVVARMVAPATTYLESACARRAGRDLCKCCSEMLVRIVVIS